VLQRILPPSKVRRMMLTGEQARAGDGGQKSEGYTTELATSADGAEARRAFFEKRKPVCGTAKS
jgi:hypothetical protein